MNEFRESNAQIAAFEIVGSGDTARKNKLQIVKDEFVYPEMGILNCGAVQTDMFITNPSLVSDFSRGALRELGLALEAAKNDARYASIVWNARESDIGKFSGMGMKSPSVTNLMPVNGENWISLKILVPESTANKKRVEIMEMGGEDLGVERGISVDPSPEKSEVLQVLPFTA